MAELPHHLEVTLFQLLGLSDWCDRAYAGEVETCPRELSRSVVGAIINVRQSLPKRGRAHILSADESGAPDFVYVEFSKWPDDTVEIEDFAMPDENAKPHWRKYALIKTNRIT